MMGVPELPDYGVDDGDQPDQELKGDEVWCMSDWEEIEGNLRDMVKKEGIHPIDPVTIASKSNPIPLKDVKKTG